MIQTVEYRTEVVISCAHIAVRILDELICDSFHKRSQIGSRLSTYEFHEFFRILESFLVYHNKSGLPVNGTHYMF